MDAMWAAIPGPAIRSDQGWSSPGGRVVGAGHGIGYQKIITFLNKVYVTVRVQASTTVRQTMLKNNITN
jgi:hypothetical protein